MFLSAEADTTDELVVGFDSTMDLGSAVDFTSAVELELFKLIDDACVSLSWKRLKSSAFFPFFADLLFLDYIIM